MTVTLVDLKTLERLQVDKKILSVEILTSSKIEGRKLSFFVPAGRLIQQNMDLPKMTIIFDLLVKSSLKLPLTFNSQLCKFIRRDIRPLFRRDLFRTVLSKIARRNVKFGAAHWTTYNFGYFSIFG